MGIIDGGLPLFTPVKWWWRAHAISSKRVVTGSAKSARWLAQELLHHACHQDRDLLDAVVVVSVCGGLLGGVLARAASPFQARRVVRLRFEWRDFEPYLGRPEAEQLTAVREMSAPGGVVRARMREVVTPS